MRLKDALGTTAVVLLLWAGGSTLVDVDVWHQMALTRAALAAGRLPTRDLFAYTPTVQPLVHHEWGSGAILYAVGRFAGLPGLQILRLALAGVVVGFAIATARRRGASVGTMILLGPLAAMMGWIGLTAVRAQLYTLAFLAALLWSLERDRQGVRISPWRWIPVFVVWANLHAGFVVGLVFLVVHAVEQWARGRPIRHLVILVTAGTLAAALNPYGPSYYAYLWYGLRLPRPLITEWRPLWEASGIGIGIVAVALALALYALARCGLSAFPGWPLLLLAAYGAVRHERHVSILAVVWAAYVPAALSGTPLGRRLRAVFDRWGTMLTVSLLATSLTLVIVERPWRLQVPGVATGHAYGYPVGPERYLREQGLRANVMTPFRAGAYLSWKLFPQVEVSIDSRYEAAYAPELLAEHLDFFHAAPGWQAIRDRYPTDLILTERGWESAGALRAEGRWTLVYEDDTYLLFARPGLSLPYRDRRGETLEGTFP